MMTGPIRIALAGLGKIARDQHVPALRSNPAFDLAGVASPHHRLDGVPCHDSIEELLRAVPDVDAVAVCTSPQVRFQIARYALERGCHVLLEKPPGVTLTEVAALVEIAEKARVALFATWHSHEAPAVETARAWLRTHAPVSVKVAWKEDVRVWHPGQDWIWEPGGLGVFDPGINALSILTHILPGPIVLANADLFFPLNRATPVAARLLLSCKRDTPIRMELDFLQTGPQTWDIEIETASGTMLLSKGGAELRIDGEVKMAAPEREYSGLYTRLGTLVRERRIDVDVAPLRLVADAFLCGRRGFVAEFDWQPIDG